MIANEVQQRIEQCIEGATAYVSGDATSHFQVMVISDVFENKTRVAQQKMVYQALADYIQSGDIHAVELKTYTPSAWDNRQ